MKEESDAKELAECMVDIGTQYGKRVAALITDMDIPLGRNIGNALEVKEAVEVLSGKGPEDLKEICIQLSAMIVSLSKNITLEKATCEAQNVLENGVAYNKFLEWISSQGGDISVFDDWENFQKPKYTYEIKSKNDGFISKMDAELIGKSSVILGAGRNKKEDEIDFTAGIIMEKKTGEMIKKGETLAVMYSSVTSDFSSAEKMYLSALEFSLQCPKTKPLIIDKVIK